VSVSVYLCVCAGYDGDKGQLKNKEVSIYVSDSRLCD
jgi:hypothetical protein